MKIPILRRVIYTPKLLIILFVIHSFATGSSLAANANLNENTANRFTTKGEHFDVTVKGTVTDASGEPIPGVTVSVSGTGLGTATDLDGNYSLTVPEGSTLVFSFIGFTSQNIVVGNQTEINVIMEEDVASLDEVVVVGYGSVRREDLTSSVSSLNERDFVAGTVSPLMAIQGKVPGLSIQSTNGADPNAGVSIQLRGVNSVNASQGP